MSEARKKTSTTFKIGAALVGFAFLLICGPYLLSLLIMLPIVWTTCTPPSDTEVVEIIPEENTDILPLLCPDAPEDGLLVNRDISLDFDIEKEPDMYGYRCTFQKLTYRDKYALQNTSDEDMSLQLYYPYYGTQQEKSELLLMVDAEPQISTPIANGTLLVADEDGWVELYKSIQAGNLAQALEENDVDTSQSTNPSAIWYFPLEVAIPAGEKVLISATWVSTEKDDRVSVTCNLLDELPSQSRTVTLWTYGAVWITDQDLALDLKSGLNRSTFGTSNENALNAFFEYSVQHQAFE